MVTPTTRSVVLVQFPFSDLSQTKLRPAVVLADAGRGDWILCQVTSKPYGDLQSVELTNNDFATGSLRLTSYARSTKLFTANTNLITSKVGKLKEDPFNNIIKTVVQVLESGRYRH
jgi:mRNA interferase MazF